MITSTLESSANVWRSVWHASVPDFGTTIRSECPSAFINESSLKNRGHKLPPKPAEAAARFFALAREISPTENPEFAVARGAPAHDGRWPRTSAGYHRWRRDPARRRPTGRGRQD